MRLIFLLLFSIPAAASAGNADKGKVLFEHGSCHACHASMVGGNGNGIFTRKNRKVQNPAELIDQLHNCSTNSGADWSEDEIGDVAAYLNREFYKFK